MQEWVFRLGLSLMYPLILIAIFLGPIFYFFYKVQCEFHETVGMLNISGNAPSVIPVFFSRLSNLYCMSSPEEAWMGRCLSGQWVHQEHGFCSSSTLRDTMG
jgi:hypothetical protein